MSNMSNISNQPKQPKLLNFKNINIEKYEYLLPHKTQYGYYQTICNYRLSKNQVLPFYFETPKLKTTSGIVKIDDKFYIDFELSQSGDIGLFSDFLSKNDDNNISVCHQNSKEWFNQTMPLNIVESYYKSPIIKKPRGQLPVFRVRLPSYKGNILTEIYNIRKEKLYDISCIQEGDYLIGIMEFSGLMFMSQNFTPCYELHKIKLFKDNDVRTLQSGYIFSDMLDTIDLNNNTIIMTDNIIEDPFVETIPIIQKQTINKDKDLQIDESILNIKTVNINPKPNTKSLFDIIKETKLKDFIFDDALFKSNNKSFNKKDQDLNIDHIKNIDHIENKNKIKPIKINDSNTNDSNTNDSNTNNSNTNNSNTNDSNTNDTNTNLNIKIQDINTIDLDIDYNLESPEIPSSPILENEITYNANSDLIDEEQNDENFLNILQNYDTSEFDEEENQEPEINQDKDQDEEEDYEEEEDGEEDEEYQDQDGDGGINFETLNDLEVIVFDE
jgi:hypothetical protein